eukprot:TRINITY_DN65626_c10_g2_i1.p1 TRINITY_DN65626_c10_g2~~TRINITY_DN65626_c10_g2_i1.p1  ORF type:complete len:142 (+),score=67.17 TRINITY_DN65626_c10_g2_i1:50-427(+)
MLTRFLSRSTAAVLRRSAATSHTRVGAVVSSRRWFGDAPSGHFLAEDEVRGRVLDVVKNFPKVDQAKVSDSAHFTNDLGLDSLDAVEVVMAFEDEFAIEISDADAEKIQSVSDAISYISNAPHAK